MMLLLRRTLVRLVNSIEQKKNLASFAVDNELSLEQEHAAIQL
jgi:hypothetical protein